MPTAASRSTAAGGVEARLDGIYVIRTSLAAKALDDSASVRAYKSLAQVERAIRSIKTVDLQVPATEAYRVFVVADFEPANLEGVALVDEADAPAPTDCPTPAG